MSLTGFPGNPPTRTYNPIIDRITALHGTISALAALHEHRDERPLVTDDRTDQPLRIALVSGPMVVGAVMLGATVGDGPALDG